MRLPSRATLNWKAGLCTSLKARLRVVKKRALSPSAPCNWIPTLPEAHLAIGFWYYHGDKNYDAALGEFQIAQRGLPNETEVYRGIGAIQRRQGKWTESTANFEKTVDLDPKDTWALQNLA